MPWSGAERIVADASWGGAACEGRVLEEGREGAVGFDIEVEIDPAVVVEDKVAEGVDALDWVGVGVVGGEEGGVVSAYELSSCFVCPELLCAMLSVRYLGWRE